MSFTATDHSMMARALQLAANGMLTASPNPMVGAVITDASGRIIGEGWHRHCGEAHAEVNAVADCPDGTAFGECTIYVTLEPCCHYGKTPPCADLLVAKGFRRVVVATEDPFAKVAGHGLEKLRAAGIVVETGLMADEARRLNRRFFTAHMLHRPWVTLKWAQSADGYIDGRESTDSSAAAISTPESMAAVHKLRAMHDAIVVGTRTLELDRPSLTVRHFAGHNPEIVGPSTDLAALYGCGITSLLVEGGRKLLDSFITAGLWDEIRVETNPQLLLGGFPYRVEAPALPSAPDAVVSYGRNFVSICHNRRNGNPMTL